MESISDAPEFFFNHDYLHQDGHSTFGVIQGDYALSECDFLVILVKFFTKQRSSYCTIFGNPFIFVDEEEEVGTPQFQGNCGVSDWAHHMAEEVRKKRKLKKAVFAI